MTLRQSLVFSVLLSLTVACQPAITVDNLPPLPDVNLADFIAPIEEQINSAIADVNNDPLNADVNGQLALVLATYSLTDAASKVYERTRLIAPKESRWDYAHGHLLAGSGESDKAIAILAKARSKNRKNFWLTYELARQYLAAGSLNESAELFTYLVDNHEERFQSFYGMGRVLIQQGKPDEALPNLQKALEIQSKIGEVHLALGTALQQTGDQEMAAHHFKLAKTYEHKTTEQFDPLIRSMQSLDRSTQPLMRKAEQYFQNRQFPEAIETLENVLKLNPDRHGAYAHLVSLYGQTGQPAKALETYNRAVTHEATNSLLHLNMGKVLRRGGKLDNAKNVLTEAIAADPNMTNAYAELGLVQEQLGNAEDAIRNFKKAVELDTDHRNANFMLGLHYAKTGDSDAAIHHLETAVKSDTSATPIHLKALAGVYMRVNDPQRAITALTRAQKLLAKYTSGNPEGASSLKEAIKQDLYDARIAAAD